MQISNSQVTYQQQQDFHTQRQVDKETHVQVNERRLAFDEQQTGFNISTGHSLSLTYENQSLSKLNSTSEVRDRNTLTKITYEQLVNDLSQGQLERNVSINNILIRGSDSAQNQSRIADLNLEQTLTSEQSQLTANNALSQAFVGPNQSAQETRVIVTERGEYREQNYTKLVSEGQIQLADGRQIDFRLELELGRDYKEVGEIKTELEVNALIDPLVINFGGSAELLGNASFEFDIDSDGEQDQLQQLNQGVGFLALDLNRDGTINNGQELFGTQSGNGFADLAQYDSDGNGWIDENDEIFNQLAIFQPQLGESETRQLTLKEAGVGAIYLGTQATEIDLKSGTNELQAKIRQQGLFLKESGEVGFAAQVDFAKQNTLESNQSKASLAQSFDQLAVAQNAIEPVSNEPNTDEGFLFARFFSEQGQGFNAELNQRLSQDFIQTSSLTTKTELNDDDVDGSSVQLTSSAADQGLTNANRNPLNLKDSLELSKPKKTEDIIESVLKPMLAQLLKQREENALSYENVAKFF